MFSQGCKKCEDESKQIRCLNAQTLRCCPGNLRTVLIVCSKYWQVSLISSLIIFLIVWQICLHDVIKKLQGRYFLLILMA